LYNRTWQRDALQQELLVDSGLAIFDKKLKKSG
jgi:hypothetical protein